MNPLTTTLALLFPTLFAGCAALPSGPNGYAGSPYYTAAPSLAGADGYGSPYYAPAQAGYAVPAYYGVPTYYGPPAYYGPSFGVAASRNPRGDEWQQERAGSLAGLQQNHVSHGIATQARIQQTAVQENHASRGVAPQARTQQSAVQENRATRVIAPQGVRGSGTTSRGHYAHARG